MRVLFFGVLTDVTGCPHLELENFGDSTALDEHLRKRFPALQEKTYRLAVNRQLAEGPVPLKAGDEVALLPPFAGG